MSVTILNNVSLGNVPVRRQGSGGGSSSPAVIAERTTWKELKDKRDNGQLIPGALYRITDYDTMAGGGTAVAGHPFDIVVPAIDEHTLSEHCLAAHSERDTEGYFDNSKLDAWTIKYCIDNDKSRFNWALTAERSVQVDLSDLDVGVISASYQDTVEFDGNNYFAWVFLVEGISFFVLTTSNAPSVGDVPILFLPTTGDAIPAGSIVGYQANENEGKGVVYRLIDEFNNDLPYDFKNIMFSRKIKSGELDEEGDPTDLYTFSIIDRGMFDGSIEGLIKHTYMAGCDESLPNNVFYQLNDKGCYDISFASGCSNNSFVGNCQCIKFGKDCTNNTFESACEGITFGNSCSWNKVGIGAKSLVLGDGSYQNEFGTHLQNVSIGCEFYDNKIESYNSYIHIGHSCNTNTFKGTRLNIGDYVTNCYVESGCCDINISSYCGHINLSGSKYVTFGNGCENITLSNVESCVFGDDCKAIKFSNCQGVEFGNGCLSIQIGDFSSCITFGQFCYSIELGNLNDRFYAEKIEFAADTRYLKISNTNGVSISSSNKMKCFKISRANNDSKNIVTLTPERNRNKYTYVEIIDDQAYEYSITNIINE